MNAKVSSPASRVQRISGLEPAQGAAPVAVKPDGEPCAGWFVVQNNGVAKGVVKGASTGGGRDAGEGGPAVRGARYAGEVAKVGASRIVEGDANLVGIIGVGGRECLRLRRVGGRLGAGDQVDVRGTKCHWCQGRWQQFLDKLGEGARRCTFRRTSASLAAVKHEKSPFKALHPVDALLVNGGTVKSRRKTLDVDNFSVLSQRWRGVRGNCRERAKPCQRQ